MRAFLRLAIVLCSFVVGASALGKGRSGSHSSGSPVEVKGYTRNDGTYVAPYHRSAPNSTKNDNWSTGGNVNPYTGKPGTKPGDGGAVTTPAPGTSAVPAASATSARASTGSTTALPTGKPLTSVVSPGMTKQQVAVAAGEPNIKSQTSWYYAGRGWVRFESERVTRIVVSTN